MKGKHLGILAGSFFGFGIVFCMLIFPVILKSQVKKQVSLKIGTEMRDLWATFPLPLDFKIYIFNVTNPDEIMTGAKPIVKEVGPFFYDEYKHKVNLVDNDEDDTVEYNFKSTWYFNPSRSEGLTGEEELTVPHLFILGMIKMTYIQQPSAMPIVNKAIDSIFKKPSSVFVKAKARDLLFDGLPVDCTVKDFAGSAACNVLKEKTESGESGLVPNGEGRYLFSIFGSKNGTVIPERLKVYRGIKNWQDVGRVIEYDGKPQLSIWTEDHCNQYNGTDTTIFAPFLTEQTDIVSFATDLCRSLSAKFSHKTVVKGVNTFRYTADLGDMSTNEDEKCYCPAPDNCLTKNLMDMYKCLNAPLIGSLPHLYDSEEKYHQMVEGLHPNQDEHEINMDFEPMTATPLSAHKRLQFNIMLGPMEKVKLLKTFPECLFPLFWVEEGILLDDQFVKKLKTVFTLITIIGFLKWLTIILGTGTSIGAVAVYLKNKDKNKLDITKVTPQMQNGKDGEKNWPSKMNISTVQSAAVPPNLDAD